MLLARKSQQFVTSIVVNYVHFGESYHVFITLSFVQTSLPQMLVCHVQPFTVGIPKALQGAYIYIHMCIYIYIYTYT